MRRGLGLLALVALLFSAPPLGDFHHLATHFLAPSTLLKPSSTNDNFFIPLLRECGGIRNIRLLIISNSKPEWFPMLDEILQSHPQLHLAFIGEEIPAPINWRNECPTFPLERLHFFYSFNPRLSLKTFCDLHPLRNFKQAVLLTNSPTHIKVFDSIPLHHYWFGSSVLPQGLRSKWHILPKPNLEGLQQFFRAFRNLLRSPQSYVQLIKDRVDHYTRLPPKRWKSREFLAEEIEPLIKEARQKFPSQVNILEMETLWLYLQGHDERAIALAIAARQNEALRNNPNARALLITALGQSGEFLEAFQELEKAIQQFGLTKDFENLSQFLHKKIVRQLEGLLRFPPKQDTTARWVIQILKQARQRYERDPRIQAGLVRAYWRAGWTPNALAEARAGYKKFPTFYSLQNLFVQLLIAEARFDEARFVLDTLKEAAPANQHLLELEENLFYTLGGVLNYLEDNDSQPQGEFDLLEEVWVATAKSILSYQSKVIQYSPNQDFDFSELFEDAEEALQTTPQTQTPPSLQHRIIQDHELFQQGLKDCQDWVDQGWLKVSDKEVTRRDFFLNRIRYKLQKGYWQSAWNWCKKAQKVFPVDPYFRQIEANLLERLGKSTEAQAVRLRLSKWLPKKPSVAIPPPASLNTSL